MTSGARTTLSILGILIAGLGIGYFFGYDYSGKQRPIGEPVVLNDDEAAEELNNALAEQIGRVTDQVPPTSCPETPVVSQAEGPFYTTGSPERTNIAETGTVGEPLVLTGYVFDSNCNPLEGAWLDFWQTDGEGNYDNVGFNLRGNQLTDETGRYVLETVKPNEYPGRPPHIHVKVARSVEGSVITSQLYFPDASTNTSDSIYDPSQLVTYDPENASVAYFNFRLP